MPQINRVQSVIGGLAEFERELIRARTGEGRERAKERGVKMGPKFKLTAHQQREAHLGHHGHKMVTMRSPRNLLISLHCHHGHHVSLFNAREKKNKNRPATHLNTALFRSP